jgi:hypothetical protein
MQRSIAALLAVLALAAPAAAATPIRVMLSAPGGHRPKANAFWRYTVRVTTLAGKPIRARLWVQISDPLGTLHAATYDNTKKPLVNWPIKGVFRDYAQFPPEAAGLRLTFRVTVRALGSTRRINYWIIAR